MPPFAATFRRPLRRPYTIRQWSALLVTICILPSTLAVCILLYLSYNRERANIENLAVGITRALMQVIDRDLASASGAMQALGTSPYLINGQIDAFYRQAVEVTSDTPDSNIILIDTSGRQLINTLRPYGTALPIHGDLAKVREVQQIRRAEVSDLYFGTVANHFVVSVDVPVIVDGAAKYVLAMQWYPDRMQDILAQQRIPEGWVAAILDSKGVVAARTRDATRFVGKPATPGLRAALTKAAEGRVEDHTMEGIPSIAFFTRSSVSNWSVAIGVHQETFLRQLTKTAIWTTASLLVVFALGLAFAIAISERIARSVRALIAPATAIGRGETTLIPTLDLRETEDVAKAIQEASLLLKQRTGERDDAAAAERDLRESTHLLEQKEAFLDGIFQGSPDATLLIIPDGNVVRANDEAMVMFDLGKTHMTNMRIDDILVAPESENFFLRDALFNPNSRHAVTCKSKLIAHRSDGTLIPVEVMSSPIRLAGTDLAIVTIRDVTWREQNEEALRQSEMRFRNILEHAPIGMAIVSLEGRWLETNNAACEMLGYSREELTSLTFQEITHPDDLAVDLEHANQLLRGEIRSYQMEKRYLRKDGNFVPALLTGTLVRDDAGVPVYFIAQMLDISERKTSEQEMKTLTDRLALATRAGGIAVWEWDMRTSILTWDERMPALYGLAPDKPLGSYENWRERVHPDDLARVESEVNSAISGTGAFSSEFRIIHTNGGTRIIHADAIVSYSPDGKPERMTGVNMDVTENRKREEDINAALKDKETLLKELYHRVKNNLQMITSMFNLQVRSMPEGPARVALREAAGRVRVIALVHEKLYQSGNLASIALDSYVKELCSQLGQLGLSEHRHIDIRVDAEHLQIGLETAIPIGVILNELISNSLKHAFPDERHGHIMVRVRRDSASDRINLSVADDGKGFPPDFDAVRPRNLGLRLVTALSRQLRGTFSAENRGGAFTSVDIPLKESQGTRESARIGEIA